MNWQCPECGFHNDNDLIRCPCGYEIIHTPEEKSKPETLYKGIGGWLIFPLLGLIITPIEGSFQMYNIYWQIFAKGYWSSLTTPGTEVYHAFFGPLLIFEGFGNSLTLALSVVTLWFFLRKSRLLPRLMISLIIFNFVFVCGDFFLSNLVPAVAAQSDSQSTIELGQAVIGTLIWIPYFLKSKRVKQTFVR
jgi:hypothetical protein